MNFLGMGPMELLLIVVLALIVFGPAKLPEIMGQVGKAIADFRRATSDLSDEFNRTIQAELQETRAMVDEAKSTLTDAKASVSTCTRRSTRRSPGTPRRCAPRVARRTGVAARAQRRQRRGACRHDRPTAPCRPRRRWPTPPQWSWQTTAQWSWDAVGARAPPNR